MITKHHLFLLLCAVLLISIGLNGNGLTSLLKRVQQAAISTRQPPAAPVAPAAIEPQPATQIRPDSTSESVTPSRETSPSIDKAAIIKQTIAAAKTVAGVKTAVAFVADNEIYIALELKPESSGKAESIEKKVMEQAKTAEGNYTIWATADKKTSSRIKAVAEGLAQGKSLSSYTNEIKAIKEKLAPAPAKTSSPKTTGKKT